MKKLYYALAASPVPTGVITHYMRPINMAPRIVSGGNNLDCLCCIFYVDRLKTG